MCLLAQIQSSATDTKRELKDIEELVQGLEQSVMGNS